MCYLTYKTANSDWLCVAKQTRSAVNFIGYEWLTGHTETTVNQTPCTYRGALANGYMWIDMQIIRFPVNKPERERVILSFISSSRKAGECYIIVYFIF